MQYNVEIVLKLFDQVSKALSQPLEQVKKLDEKLKATHQTAENLQSPFARLKHTIKETFNPEHLEAFSKHLENVSEKLDHLAGNITKAIALPMAGITASVLAYSDASQTDATFTSTFMVNKKAFTPQAYKKYEEYVKKIRQIAFKYGDKYPGDIDDYLKMAMGLKYGLSGKAIADGGLKAAAELSVVLPPTQQLDPQQLGQYIAQFKNAYQISSKDLPALANRLQKLMNATGITMQDIARISGQVAPALTQLHVTGMQGFKTVTVLLAAMQRAGVDGPRAGIAIREMVAGIDRLPQALQQLGREHINFHIDLNKFYKDGHFQMLQFFNALQEKLSHVKNMSTRLQILSTLFGPRGLTAAGVLFNGDKKQAEEYVQTLLRMGKITQQQYQKMMQSIEQGNGIGIVNAEEVIAKQANIQQRLKLMLGTFQNRFKALTGTIVNLSAQIGGLMAPPLIFAMKKLNEFLSLVHTFIAKHKALARAIILPPAAFVGFLSLIAAVAKLASGIFSFISGGVEFAMTMFKIAGSVFRVGMMIFRFLIPALNMLKVVFLTNPLGLFITAVVAAVAVGYLLYTHWKQITAWFKTHFPNAFKAISAFIEGFKKAMAPALKSFSTAVQPIVHAFTELFNVLKSVFGAIVRFFTPAHETMKKTSHTAKQLSHAVKSTADAFQTFKEIGEFIGFIFSLPLRGIVLLIDAIKWLVKAIVGAVGVIESIFTGIANILRTAFRVYISIIQTEFRIATAIFHFYIQLWIRIFKLLEQAGIFVFRKIAQSVNFIKNAWNTAIRFISSINLFKAGQNILNTLVQGIESVAMKPVQVMKNVVQKIRNLLPFSPAKEGPLRDLHRIKLIQTIADTIKPDPLVEKMRQALAQAVSIPIIPAPTAAVGMGSHTTFHIIVNSTNNFTTDTKPEVANTIAGNIEKEVRRVLERINQDKKRRQY